MFSPMALALVHHPVRDRRGDVVTSAVTNLDIHDLARLAATYGLSRFYLVTPVREQQVLIERIVGHWREGFGAEYNRDRKEALGSIVVVDRLEDAVSDWRGLAGPEAMPVLTGARHRRGLGRKAARDMARTRPLLLLFGTGHGFAEAPYRQGWPQLAALRCHSYNHLSVRTAAAITLDRLIGERGQVRPLERAD